MTSRFDKFVGPFSFLSKIIKQGDGGPDTMDWFQFTGWITMLAALGMVFVAMPLQIRKQYRLGGSQLNWFFLILPLIVFVSRSAHAFLIPDYFIAIPDIFGAIEGCIMISQKMGYFVRKQK